MGVIEGKLRMEMGLKTGPGGGKCAAFLTAKYAKEATGTADVYHSLLLTVSLVKA